MLMQKHLIAGEWVGDGQLFVNEPVSGGPQSYAEGTDADVDAACNAAEGAFAAYSATMRADRAAFLRRIADEIAARTDDIVAIGSAETGLPPARLTGEVARTTGQLRLFADHIEAGDYLDRRHDTALPDRTPLPRPELWMVQRPIGPIAVFGASNFPLAFSVAGGDTASALAAGCPVVVKGHPAHPGTSDLVAQAIDTARRACGLPAGVFNLIQGAGHTLGAALVRHPFIQAVGFTGSLAGGRALFDLCATRPHPIPFFGELGSINPVFVLQAAQSARGAQIGADWAGSLTMGVGQFCTNPGVLIVGPGQGAEALIAAAEDVLAKVEAQPMLTRGLAGAFRDGAAEMSRIPGVRSRIQHEASGRSGAPSLIEVDAATWLAEPALAQEVFGPAGIVVRATSTDDIFAIAMHLDGQLTCTLQFDATDTDTAAHLVPILERKAGRLLANGFPTGVEVAEAMVHGGPYPASTNFGATSVGTLALRRWLRPVCYQNMPKSVLPADLRD